MPTTELRIIREISDVLAETPDYQEGLNRSTALLARKLGADACSILVYDEVTDELILAAWSGPDAPTVPVRISPTKGITGLAFRTRQPVHAPSITDHPEYSDSEEVWNRAYESCLALPLAAAGQTIGVMVIATRESWQFDDRTVALAQAVALPLAMSVLTARAEKQFASSASTSGGRRPRAAGAVSPVLEGTPISGGVISGRAYLVAGAEKLERIPLQNIDDPEKEIAFFEKVVQAARADATETQEQAARLLPEADAAIFLTHLLLLDDPTLRQRVVDAIRNGFALRFALRLAAEQLEEEFRAADNPMVRERVADLKDVILRIVEAADRCEAPETARRKSIAQDIPANPVAVARELLPSQLIRLPLGELAGVVCEQGGATTHVAILSKALRLPMLVGVSGALAHIRPGDPLIVDCATGLCHVRPGPEIVRKFRPALRFHKTKTRRRALPSGATCRLCATADGVPVRLGGNISLISELPLLERYGAMGIGLYRSEFLFMIRPDFPSEDSQYKVFQRIVEGSPAASVTLRILDVGGDKPLPYTDFGSEANPFLGWRGMRFLLDCPQYFEPHLRAILRATVHGKVSILIPMVADVAELLEVKAVMTRVEAGLRRDGVAFDEDYRLGIMLEVPSAVWGLPEILPHVDFVSIGTNDLTQYVFAVDRGNERVSRWFRPLHPVVLRILKHTCELAAAAAPPKPVSLCGELAGSALAAPLLVGAGIRYLSMNPWQIPRVREVISKLRLEECRDLLDLARGKSTAGEVFELLKSFMKTHGLTERGDPTRDGSAPETASSVRA
ncbi:MAG: phosphoenolpyruvate--protein phosphotransferase [Kiritimatiellaeota bacterium]|nr:phosphoenolpyruvate--protein phosphotransferase [Kiritimatiellota bacterium]